MVSKHLCDSAPDMCHPVFLQQDYQSLIPHFVSAADVFICGGYNGELILADLWKINLQTFQWSKLPAVMPEPAYFHCAAVTPVSRAQT